jgi:hypothetical protein
MKRSHLVALIAAALCAGCSASKRSANAPPPAPAAAAANARGPQQQRQQQQQQVVIEIRVVPEDAPTPTTSPAATSQPGEAVHLIALVKPSHEFSVSATEGKWTHTATGRVILLNPATQTYRVALNYRATSADGSKGLQTTWELKPGESMPIAGMLGGAGEQQVVIKLVVLE